MVRLAALTSLILLQASCADPRDEHANLMREIDMAIVMPKNAFSLDQYARYFAKRPDGKVVALYTAFVRDDAPKSKDYGCSEIMADDTLKDVPCPPDKRPHAGKQLWVAYNDIPDVSDGGCSIVNVVYDISLHKVEKISCNGPS